MSTIKSSTEHLTLNADGSGKDIKFQANGVEKASISSTGAFTSTSIDATKLSGTVPNFTSTGIDDNATSTAITITSDGRGLSQFTAKAWVNFNGTGTVAIRDSHNVSSVTDYGTGDYGANFSNNMANSNYNAVSSGKFYSWDSSYLIDSTTTSYLQIASVRSSNNTYEDTPIITAIVFGD